jgi:lipid-A-disaccharide synthase
VVGHRKQIMVIAGEASGDLYGGQLVRAMRGLDPDLDFFGIGGEALRRAGVQIRFEHAQMSVVGIYEALKKITLFRRLLRLAREDLRRIHPALLILIDFPDFNFRVAAAAKQLGIPVMYYVSPQIWAWRSGRVKKVKKLVDHMVVLFPFEVDFYKRWQVPVTFVGHPLLDITETGGAMAEDLSRQGPLIGLLPGSRDQEVKHHLPTMVKAAKLVLDKIHEARFAIPVPSSVSRDLVETILEPENGREFVVLFDGVRSVLRSAVLVITASGTVTLEAAIMGVPMIIIYKLSGLSYWFGKHLIRVDHIGLANLVAGKRIVPELIQDAASAENISRCVLQLLADERRLADMRQQLRHVLKSLGAPGASERAAEVAMGLIFEK